jgi:hypothetical protein
VIGVANGGTPVIDYSVYYGPAAGGYTTLITGITSTSYTVTGLTAGTTYKFKVLSRNAFATSAYSTSIQVLAAQ